MAGRPRKGKDKRELVVSFRVAVDEYRYLRGLALRRGVDIASVVRSLALADMPVPVYSAGEKEEGA